MTAYPRELRRYITGQGQVPFEEWLESLKDRKTRSRIRARLDRVEQGNLGDSKSVGDGVFELRIDFGPGYRVYFGQVGLKIVLLLCGGDKSSQDQDIKKAKEYWIDYEKRESTNE